MPGRAAAGALWLVAGKATVPRSLCRVCGPARVHRAQCHLWHPGVPGHGQAGQYHQPLPGPSGTVGPTAPSPLNNPHLKHQSSVVNLVCFLCSALQGDCVELLPEDDSAQHNGPHPLRVSETGMFCLFSISRLKYKTAES